MSSTDSHEGGLSSHQMNRPAIWLFLTLLSLYLITFNGQLSSSDGVVMYQTTAAIAQYGTLRLEPNPGLPQILLGRDGHWYGMYDLGQPIAALPFYVVGRWVSQLLPASDPTTLTVFAVSLLPVLATAYSGVVFYKTALLLFGKPAAGIIVALLWGTGTIAWHYTKVYFSEALLTLCLLSACYFLFQNSKRAVFWGGLALGAMISIRTAALIYYPACVLYLVLSSFRDRTTQTHLLMAIANFSVGMAAAVLLLLWHNYARFGTIFQSGYAGQGFTTPLVVGLYGLLFSPGRSIFLYSPPAILGLMTLPKFYRRFPAAGIFIGAAFSIALVFYGCWWTWHGGWSWGPRFLVPVIPLLLIPIGVGLHQQNFRRSIPVIWGMSALAIIPGLAVNFNAYIIAITQGDYSRENLLWFYPEYSPLVGHWHYLLGGEANFWGGAPSGLGLPPISDVIWSGFWLLALMVSCYKLVCIVSQYRELDKAPVNQS